MVKKGVARTKNQFASMVFTKFTNEGIIYNQLHSAQRAKNLATFFATASRFALRKNPLPIALNGFTAPRLS